MRTTVRIIAPESFSVQTAEIITETSRKETTMESTAQTVTETSFVISLPNLRTIDFDGVHLPDGIYQFRPVSIDKDRLGCSATISAYYYLLEEDLGSSFYWCFSEADLNCEIRIIGETQGNYYRGLFSKCLIPKYKF